MKRLTDVARIIRSKNAGPFELTLDVIFDDDHAFELARACGGLSAEAIARAYRLPIDAVLSTHFFAPARAFKATLRRAVSCGAPGDRDVFGAQQHAPLLELELPWPDD